MQVNIIEIFHFISLDSAPLCINILGTIVTLKILSFSKVV